MGELPINATRHGPRNQSDTQEWRPPYAMTQPKILTLYLTKDVTLDNRELPAVVGRAVQLLESS